MEIIEVKEGVKLHYIKKEIFKTDCSFITFTIPLIKKDATKNALLAYILMRGTQNYPDQYELNKALDNNYGSTLSVSFDKVGDNVSLRFNMESIANRYALDGENVLKTSLEILFDLAFNPLRKDGMLSEDFITLEKEHLIKILKSEKDNKDSYAYKRALSETFLGDGFGVNLYGYEDDVQNIDIKELTEYYDWIVNNSRIDIAFSGDSDIDTLKNIIFSNEKINNLVPRKSPLILSTEAEQKVEKANEITDKMDVVQGKLVLGMITQIEDRNIRFIGQVYNAILGGTANSFLFQNVREKNGMAYSIGSNFVKLKKAVFIRCGIEIENYLKALELIYTQLDYMKNGDFTEEDIENAKIYLISNLDSISEEQVSEMFFYLGQDFTNENLTIEQYKEGIRSVDKDDLMRFANSLSLKTIYLLRN